ERNPAHPHGEVFIAGNDKAVQAARTPAVEEALGDGRLVLVQPPTTQPAPPWDGYDAQSVDQIVERLPDLNESERAQVLAYERSAKNRKGIVQTLVNWNS